MTYGIRYTEPAEGLDLDARNRELRHLLQEHDCEVTFTKVDGSVRIMPCTLREAAIPAKPVDIGSKSNEKRLRALDVMSVWCLDKSEWRSFKIANVQEIRVIGS
jgi:WYL_2, Sm-like SH3 beta-barrel fold